MWAEEKFNSWDFCKTKISANQPVNNDQNEQTNKKTKKKQNLWFNKQEKKKRKHESMEESPFLSTDSF